MFDARERLHAICSVHASSGAQAIADALVGEVVGFQRGDARDDIAVVVLQAPPLDVSR